MKRLLNYRNLTILIFVIILTGCAKDEGLITKLQLGLYVDQLGALAGTEVSLYTSQEDMLAGTNPASETKITDENGIVVFDSLEPVTYYWRINNDCFSNLNLSNYSNITIKQFRTTYITARVLGNSSLVIINNSETRYNIDINKLGYSYLYPHDTIEFYNILYSDYEVNLINPEPYSDTTFTISVPCSDTVFYFIEE
jgi:hypothetical protein